MRTFLVVMDETREARSALRYASRRAATVDGAVHILALVPQQNVSAFGGVQATIEQEARDRAEMLAHGAAGNLFSEIGIMPAISVRVGNAQKMIVDFLEEHREVAALVLGAAAGSNPGPLVTYFAERSGELPCPLYIIPEGYDDKREPK